MCSSMKQPKPERLVEILGMPITVHSAAVNSEKGFISFLTPPPAPAPTPSETAIKASTAPSSGTFAKCRALCWTSQEQLAKTDCALDCLL